MNKMSTISDSGKCDFPNGPPAPLMNKGVYNMDYNRIPYGITIVIPPGNSCTLLVIGSAHPVEIFLRRLYRSKINTLRCMIDT